MFMVFLSLFIFFVIFVGFDLEILEREKFSIYAVIAAANDWGIVTSDPDAINAGLLILLLFRVLKIRTNELVTCVQD